MGRLTQMMEYLNQIPKEVTGDRRTANFTHYEPTASAKDIRGEHRRYHRMTSEKVVTYSTCKRCDSYVRSVGRYLPNRQALDCLEAEAKRHDLEIKDLHLYHFRRLELLWCKCDVPEDIDD